MSPLGQTALLLEHRDTCPVLRLYGEFDLASRATLASSCAGVVVQPGHGLLVDLSQVGFLDCGSIRVLELLGRRVVDGGGQAVLIASPAAMRVIGMYGLCDGIQLVTSTTTAKLRGERRPGHAMSTP